MLITYIVENGELLFGELGGLNLGGFGMENFLSNSRRVGLLKNLNIGQYLKPLHISKLSVHFTFRDVKLFLIVN